MRVASSGASPVGRFVTASKGMARALAEPPAGARVDGGAALFELLGFSDAVTASQPPRPFEPLAFPALAGLAERRLTAAGARQR